MIVLCPSPDVALQPDVNWHKQAYINWIPYELDRGLRDETPRVGLWLDTSHLTVEQTVSTIFDQVDSARLQGGKSLSDSWINNGILDYLLSFLVLLTRGNALVMLPTNFSIPFS